MILYFSATGNCKYVAERIAMDLQEEAVSIEGTQDEFSVLLDISGEKMLGIVTPTYAWELPIIVREYLEKLILKGYTDQYIFTLATYGTSPGATGAEAAHILKKKGLSVSARYSIQMPDTWTPVFDLSDHAKVKRQLDEAEKELDTVIASIKEGKTGNRMRRDMPYAIRLITDLAYESMRKTNHFTVEDTCIGCGLCERKCPVQAIMIRDKKPVWTQDKCVMCLRCLHSCPKFSIQYGKNTRKHGQYRNPNVKIQR